MPARSEPSEGSAIIRCALLLIGVIAVGTLGFHLIEEDWTLWDCFYFTIVTITTVGYGDYGLCRNGQAFAALLMVSGFGVFTYSLTTLVRIAADSDAARRRKMKRDISQCEGHIVICGYGRVGRTICAEVRRGGLDCVVIESSEQGYRKAVDDGRLVVHGHASEDEVLVLAGVKRARGIVCVVDSDAENMFITVSARDLNPDITIISRAESETAGQKLRRAGASLVVSPHQMAGETVANAVLNPRLSKFMGAACENRHLFRMGETVVHPGSELSGQTIEAFGGKAEGLVFIAIEREDGEMVIRPRGYEGFRDGDVVIYAGSPADTQFIQTAAKSCAVLR
ncbi:MAG: potassium channel protein [Planctomycetota bacterium]